MREFKADINDIVNEYKNLNEDIIKEYRCNECYQHINGNEGCYTPNPKKFINNKIAPCLDGTWDGIKKQIPIPLFYEIPLLNT